MITRIFIVIYVNMLLLINLNKILYPVIVHKHGGIKMDV